MIREMLLERVQGQVRLAIMEDRRLCEINYERGNSAKLAGNIYAGRVQNVLPGMNAAFVDIGLGKNAFLYAGDICFDTRGQQALQKTLEDRRIEKMLRSGQMIIAQVVKEPGGNKGPRISGSITLPGRYSVMIPGIRYAGVSRKIEDAAERDRLYAIAQRISEKSGTGVIIRTAAEGADEVQVCADYEALSRQWKKIEEEGRYSAQPRLIQSDGSLVLRAMRDLMDAEMTAVRTDDPALYDELKACAALFAPEYAGRIHLEKSEMPLFDLHRVDKQLEDAFKRLVWLKSGGTIVIDQTEAMTVIDVNTGKFTGKKSLQDTIFAINCEAADEIARQLRLRDLGGIIIIDFIDMDAQEKRDMLIARLRDALKNDRNHTNVLGMTSLGLVEMTRKKVRQPLSKLLMHDCSACNASGFEWTHESTAYQAVREIWQRRRAGDTSAYRIVTGEKVAGWLRTIGLPAGGVTEVSARGTDGKYEIVPLSFDLKTDLEFGNEEML